ncbi:hypothetical protein Pcinc_037168 [Petrolisthes cinctipes]|uniref:Uncharacterized protein n=1 Tax=Petrolisthes cinctipes TaxID=88211 RepID=A0AAE1EL85_PETCI|nr:hypothetical protein Pcinc_037168 [Petrolisthes cinctipes]
MGPKIAYIAADTMKRKEMEEVEETEKKNRKGEKMEEVEESEERNREGKKRNRKEEEMEEPATTNTTTSTIANTITTTTTCVSVGVGTDNVGHHPTFDAAGTADQTTCHHTTTTLYNTAPPEDHPVSPTRRICRVCGDRAKSMHFGGLSCDSCKAFFRRAVHNDAHTNFSCPYDGFCVMNITSRKCCQFCRYKKCLSIGMEPRWVMSEEERKHRLRQRADKRTKLGEEDGKGTLRDHKRGLVPYEPDPATLLHYMTTEEWDEVEQAVRNYQLSYTDVPYLSDLLSGWNVGRPSVHIVAMFTTIIKRFAYFARLFPAFLDLTSHDQETLLRTGILEMSLIRGVQTFDTSNNRWPDSSHLLYHSAPALKAEDMKKLVSCELYETHMKFIHSLKELGVDEPVMMLLLLIVLFTSDRPGLKDTAAVQIKQDHYLLLLRKYLGWRHGPHNARLLYPRLLLKLTDLRELNDQHNNYNLKLAKREIKEIQTQLGEQEAAQGTTRSTDQHHHNLASFLPSTVCLGNSPSSPKLFVKSDHSLPSGNNYVANVIQNGQCLPELTHKVQSNTTLVSGRAQTVVTSGIPNVQPEPPNNKSHYTSLNADLASVLISLDLEEELTSDPNFLRLLIQHIKQSFLAATTSWDMNNECPLIGEQTLKQRHTMVQKYPNQDVPQEHHKHTIQQHNPGHQQYQQPEHHKLQQYQQQYQMHQQKHQQQHPFSIPNEATNGTQDTNTHNPLIAQSQTQQQYDLHMRLQQQNTAFITEYSLLEQQQRRRRQQQEEEIKSALLMVKAEYDQLNPTSTNDSQFMQCEDHHNQVYHNISNSTSNCDFQDSRNYFMQQQSPDTEQPIPPHTLQHDNLQHTSPHSWQQTSPHSLQQTPPHSLQHTPPHGLQHTPPLGLQQTPIEQSPWDTLQHNSSIVFQQGVPEKCLTTNIVPFTTINSASITVATTPPQFTTEPTSIPPPSSTSTPLIITTTLITSVAAPFIITKILTANQFIRSKLDGVQMGEEQQVGRRVTEVTSTLPTSCTDSMPRVCDVMDVLCSE